MIVNPEIDNGRLFFFEHFPVNDVNLRFINGRKLPEDWMYNLDIESMDVPEEFEIRWLR